MKKLFLLWSLLFLHSYLFGQIFNSVDYVSVYPYAESFEEGLGDWVQGVGDSIDWTWNSGNTRIGAASPSGTGPFGAQDGTYYMYLESEGVNHPNKTGEIYSPFFDLRVLSFPRIKFYYHMRGSNMGTLDLEISLDNGVTWTSIWSKSGNQGTSWKYENISLSSYDYTPTIQFRFLGTTGSDSLSDIAIDNIEITGSFCGTVANTTLPFFEGFEYSPITYIGSAPDDVICNPTYKWEFDSDHSTGRMKMGKDATSDHTGHGAVTLDRSIDFGWWIKPMNYLILTLDLSAYSNSTNLNLSFDYKNHKDENDSKDKVWIRGSKTSNWLQIYDWNTSSSRNYSGWNYAIKDIDALLASYGQTPTNTFQIRFGQTDDDNSYGSVNVDGLSVDNLLITDSTYTSCDTAKVSDLYVTYTNPTDVTLNCKLISAIALYGWRHREIGTNNWNYSSWNSSNSHFLTHLTPGTTYEYQVRTRCATTRTYSSWSASNTFTTDNFNNLHAPNAVDDYIKTDLNTTTVNNIIYNDSDNDGNQLTLQTTPVTLPTKGTVIIDANGLITYTPNNGLLGIDSFIYRICDDGVPSFCSTAKVVIHIKDLSITEFDNFNCNTPPNTFTVTNHKSIDGTLESLTVVVDCDSVIDKPLIFVEPFELGGDDWTIDIFRDSLKLLYDKFKQEGYDIIYLDLDNNNGYIQNNAFLVQRVIKALNTLPNVDSLVVIGASMGGLISRYAIADMEQKGEQHRVRLYCSIDSPHKGANLPLSLLYVRELLSVYPTRGLQPSFTLNINSNILQVTDQISLLDIMNFISNSASDTLILDKVNKLLDISDSGLSPAASQMILQGFKKLEYDDIGDLLHYIIQSDTSYTYGAFMEEYNQLGLPQYCRNIAISNGSTCDEPLPNEGDIFNETISEEIPSPSNNIKFYFESSIIAKHSEVGTLKPILSVDITLRSEVKFQGFTVNLEIFSRAVEILMSDNMRRDFLSGGYKEKSEYNIPKFSFVPTSSAVDIPLYSPNYHTTPFDNYLLFDRKNTSHVKGANHLAVVEWLMAELNGNPDTLLGCGNFPDLAFEDGSSKVLSDSIIFCAGDTINRITSKIVNQGDTIASNPSILNFYLSDDGVIDSADTLLGSLSINPLQIDASENDTLWNAIIPSNTTAGAKYLLLEADADQDIEEQLEGNNIDSILIIIKDTATVTIIEDSLLVPVTWNVIETDEQHVIFIYNDIVSKINDTVLTNGDYIGAFYSYQDSLYCGGIVEWNDSITSALIVNGNNSSNSNKDGFNVDEPFQLKIFRPSTQQEYFVAGYYLKAEEDTSGLVNALDSFNIGGISAIDSIFTIDTIYTTDCVYNIADTGISVINTVSQYGFDEITVITNIYQDVDTTLLTLYSCDPSDVGTIQDTLFSEIGCDSLIIITTTDLLDNDTTYLYTSSCNPADTGIVIIPLINQNNCDSLLITITTLLPSDTTFMTSYSCNPTDTGTFIISETNQYGCDSSIITTILLLPSDTTYLSAITCNPTNVGEVRDTIPNQYGCDSLIITDVILATDTTYLTDYVCSPTNIRLDTVFHVNQQNCDSLVITDYILAPHYDDTTVIYYTTCDISLVDTVYIPFINEYGCDSTRVEITVLLPSDTTYLSNTSCNPMDVGFDTTFLQNQFLCDSLIITYTSLLPSDTTHLSYVVCDINQSGTFYDTLPNQYGCDSVIITTNTLSTLQIDSLTKIDANCGAANGSMMVHVSGGLSPYSYIWTSGGWTNNPSSNMLQINNGIGADTISSLDVNTYYITIQDANNCRDSSLSNIIFANNPYITLDGEDAKCFGEATGAIYPTFHDAVPPYQYSWSTGATTSYLDSIPAGYYVVSITDSYGCPRVQAITLDEPSEITISYNPWILPTGCNSFDGFLSVIAIGGTPPYSYSWSNGTSSNNNPNINPGDYTITVSDSLNCEVSSQVTLPYNPNSGSIIQPTAAFDIVEENFEVITFENNSINGVLYEWNFGDGSPIFFTTEDSNVTHIFPYTDTFEVALKVYSIDSCVVSGIDEFKMLPFVIFSDVNQRLKISAQVKVIPNPNRGYFDLYLQDLPYGDWNIEIQNIVGQIVYSQSTNITEEELYLPIQMSNIAKGMYTISVQNGKGQILIKKFIVIE